MKDEKKLIEFKKGRDGSPLIGTKYKLTTFVEKTRLFFSKGVAGWWYRGGECGPKYINRIG